MEIEFFIKPSDEEGDKWFDYWLSERQKWYIGLGIRKENLKTRPHADDERAHYARKAVDIEYNAPFGWSEFEGIHHRGDWDLGRHKLTYLDPETHEEYTPWVIETSGGVDRATLFFLLDAYRKEPARNASASVAGGEKRIVLGLHPKLAPVKVAVFPLVANKAELVGKAKLIYDELKKYFMVAWDDRGNIGKRYLAQDEVGTPWCVTVDYATLEDDTVTVRDRDTTHQERININNLVQYFQEKLL